MLNTYCVCVLFIFLFNGHPCMMKESMMSMCGNNYGILLCDKGHVTLRIL